MSSEPQIQRDHGQADVLSGIRILEFSAIGPVPWGVNVLADMGATVTRVRRPGAMGPLKPADAISERSRNDVVLDLKTDAGRVAAAELIRTHDVVIEGMRPGVMERLGLGPEACHIWNPGLVYVRVTGWGQDGPLAQRAGHDINYIALSGALHAIGPKEGAPSIPLNLVGDYGGGGAFMAIGVLGGLLKRNATGQGSVVDVAMLDGAARQMGVVYERLALGEWRDMRGSNALDGGVPWYSVYQARCGGYVAVGAIEPQFYDELVAGLELDTAVVPDRRDPANWPALRRLIADCFLKRTRDEWTQVFEEKDACVSPVLSLSEAPCHPHNEARRAFQKTANGGWRPAAAPRFHTSPVFEES